jgi:hypothetical protein
MKSKGMKKTISGGSIMALPFLILAACTGPAKQTDNEVSESVFQSIVYHQEGRFAGWPANNGAWSFDKDEMLVGFTEASYVVKDGHNIEKPYRSWLARSTDGGETWEAWDPDNYVGDFGKNPELKTLDEAINFQHKKFAMRVVGTAYHGAEDPRGHFFYSYDAGRSWNGPFGFGDFQNHEELTRYWDEVELTPRTDYLVTGPQECIIFMSARPKGKSGKDRLFCVKTSDGGQTFEFLSWVVRPYKEEELGQAVKVPLYEDQEKNPWSTQCRAVMSQSFALENGDILTIMRRKYKKKGFETKNWVDAYQSSDGGLSWEFQSKVGDSGEGNGNPPSLAQTQDGRFVAVFGERKNGTIQSAISSDKGQSWGTPQVLYDNFWNEDMEYNDIGYPRVLRRSDGRMVALFYYSTREARGQIHATIWEP